MQPTSTPYAGRFLWGLCIVLFAIFPFINTNLTQDPEIAPRYFGLAILLTGFSFYLLINNKHKISFPASPAIIAYFIFLLIVLIGTFRSINPGDALYEFSKLALNFSLFLLFTILIREVPGARKVISRMVCVAVFLFSIYAFLQLFYQWPWKKLDTSIIVATLANKNFFAETILMSLPFTLYLTFTELGKDRVTGFIATLAAITDILITQSLGVFIGAFAGIVVLTALYFMHRKSIENPDLPRRLKRKHIYISLVILMVVGFSTLWMLRDTGYYRNFKIKIHAANNYLHAPGQLFENNDSLNNNSFFDRLLLARNSLYMVKEHPLTGVGTANWKLLFPKYGLTGNTGLTFGRLRFEHPHDEYLLMLSEWGLTGLLVWIMFLFLLIRTGLKQINHAASSEDKWWSLLLVTGVTMFVVICCFSYPMQRFFSMTLFGILAAFISISVPDNKTKIINPGIVSKGSLLILFSCISVIMWLRLRGEAGMRKVLDAQSQKNFPEMVEQAGNAYSWIFPLDISGTPVPWFQGFASYYQGKTDDALSYYQKAALINPYHLQVQSDLGSLYDMKGEHEKAIVCFRKTLEINKGFPFGLANMSAAYFNMGEVDSAFYYMNAYPYRYTPKWRDDMNTILTKKAEILVNATQDTLLANKINHQLKYFKYFLLNKFLEGEKKGHSFEEELKAYR